MPTKRRSMKNLLKVALVAAAVAGLASGPAQAASKPAKATLDAAHPKVAWTGSAGNVNPVACTGPLACEHFALKIVPVPGQPVRIVVDVPAGADYDLYVYSPNGGEVGNSGNLPGEDEVVLLKAPKPGVYDVVVQPYLIVPGTAYKAQAAFVPAKK